MQNPITSLSNSIARQTRTRIAARKTKTYVMTVPTLPHELLMSSEGYFILVQDEVVVKIERVFDTSPLSMLVVAKGSHVDMIDDYMSSGHYGRFCYEPSISPLKGEKINQLTIQPNKLMA